MQDPILEHIYRSRARFLKELKRDFNRALAEAHDRFLRSCDVVISPTGETQYVTSKEKLYEVYIAPKLREKEARARARAKG